MGIGVLAEAITFDTVIFVHENVAVHILFWVQFSLQHLRVLDEHWGVLDWLGPAAFHACDSNFDDAESHQGSCPHETGQLKAS